ncbi:PAS domain S-box protein [Thalassospira sp. UBA4513]|uniref:PAS domain S-box protein n=1 Tax=Thalassospira sp. UBA4513 TaxID=1947675 RepID=UPI00257AD21A|nr:PAS domain S-box protein [Thalassospira sp. UBA4513]|tara:strand:- start:2330 stop:3682 length:1353 start_codon:yes stop_codon:yes gene_type:complete
MNSLTSIPVEPTDIFPGVPGMVDASFSVVEFDLTGKVVRANANFLSLTGYDEDEVLGQHHSMFLSDDVVDAPEYGLCWVDLKAGKTKRVILPWVTKTGQRKWVEESIGPVKDCTGNVVRILRLGVDVTERHESLADLQGKVDAIEHSQAVIEFDTKGNILTANYNFLVAMGYCLSEVVGKHHSMFVDREYAAGPEYRAFWRALAKGKNRACQFKRFGKDGREVWFEASYSPVYGADGKVCKVVKFATDITDQVTSLTRLKTTLEAGCDAADQSVGRIDQSYDDVSVAWRKAYAHLEVSTMVGARLVSSVDETAERMTEMRSVADQAFDHAIESDCAIAALEEAVDVLRDCARDDAAIIKQINILEKCISENARISSTVRTDIDLMRSRVAVVSLAVAEQANVTNQVSGELCSVQTALESSEHAFKEMVKASEDVSAIVGQTREASGILAR